MSALGAALVWAECLCHVWPIALGAPAGRCGRCGSPPLRLASVPADGRAHDLPGGLVAWSLADEGAAEAECADRFCGWHYVCTECRARNA